MEEKYKSEERREIIGEEWRKISRILDKFLLIVFTCASLITTLWSDPDFITDSWLNI